MADVIGVWEGNTAGPWWIDYQFRVRVILYRDSIDETGWNCHWDIDTWFQSWPGYQTTFRNGIDNAAFQDNIRWYEKPYNTPWWNHTVGTLHMNFGETHGCNKAYTEYTGDSGTTYRSYLENASYTVPLPSYTILYNSNGGWGAPMDQTKQHGVNLRLSPSSPRRDGYTFKGWSTSSNGSVQYQPGSIYTGNGNVTLYAIWELYIPPDPYTADPKAEVDGVDWKKTGYTYDVHVDIVHQTNVDNVLGQLKGVTLEGLKITESYYSDSRVQAKVSTIGQHVYADGYVENARLRIVLSIPSKEWSRNLMTGYVSDIKQEYKNGYVKKTYTLEGTMWGLLNHKLSSPVTIALRAELTSICRSLLDGQTKMQYEMIGAQMHYYRSTILYEAGTNLSTVLFELNESYNRIDVDGLGRITFKKYVAPSKQTPSKIIVENDGRDLVLSNSELELTGTDSPGRAIVTATVTDSNNNQQTIVGAYDAPSGHKSSIANRGYLIARTDSYTGSSNNPSTAELNNIAKTNWTNSQSFGAEWTITTVFGNYHAGDVVEYSMSEDNPRKCLIKTAVTNLDEFTQELTLKDLGSTISQYLNDQYY